MTERYSRIVRVALFSREDGLDPLPPPREGAAQDLFVFFEERRGGLLLLVAEGAKDGVILVAGDVEVMKALPA